MTIRSRCDALSLTRHLLSRLRGVHFTILKDGAQRRLLQRSKHLKQLRLTAMWTLGLSNLPHNHLAIAMGRRTRALASKAFRVYRCGGHREGQGAGEACRGQAMAALTQVARALLAAIAPQVIALAVLRTNNSTKCRTMTDLGGSECQKSIAARG